MSLWHNCLDKQKDKWFQNQTDVSVIYLLFWGGFLTKTTYFLHASREMDGISFSWQMTHVFEALSEPL